VFPTTLDHEGKGPIGDSGFGVHLKMEAATRPGPLASPRGWYAGMEGSVQTEFEDAN